MKLFKRFNRKYDATQEPLRFLLFLWLCALWYVPSIIGIDIVYKDPLLGSILLGFGAMWLFIILAIFVSRGFK